MVENGRFNEDSNFGSGNVLIVDDREENLFALKELLAEQCNHISCVNSGNEALSLLLKENNYALILLDVQMPGLDGFETLSLMKNHPKTRDIPVIFITAIHKEEKYLHLGFKTGAVDYICKPIDPIIMRSKVSVFLTLESDKQKIAADLEEISIIEKAKQSILSSSAQGIISVDEFGFIDYVNPASSGMLGYAADKLTSKHVFSIISPDIPFLGNWTHSIYSKAIQDGQPILENNIHLYHHDGTTLSVDLSFGPHKEGMVKGGVFIVQDITERKKEEDDLLFLATHDSLTNLPNKLMFKETVVNAISRAKRYENELYIMFIDLDHFKNINDELGHCAGDCLLRDVANRLLGVGRDVDVFSRIGGDEFAVVFEDKNKSFNTDVVASKLLSVLKQPFYFDNQEMYISASIGIVKYPEYGKTADDLIQAADIAMYRAKQAGRNRFEHFDVQSKIEAVNRVELEYNLKQAVSNKEILCFYQPIVDVDGQTRALEVLVRWEHPILGILGPDKFLGLAESTGIISELSYQVIVTACDQLKKWQDENLCQSNIKLSINLSSKQFFRKTIVEDMLRLKRDHNIKLENIILEVTEATIIENVGEITRVLKELKSMGLKLSLDNYGAGYSSLHLLSNLPLDYLKIDKSFINKIKPVNQNIVDTMIKFAKLMSIKVVAVGVESVEQYDSLVEAGVDYLQGNYIHEASNSAGISYKFKSDHPRQKNSDTNNVLT